MPATRKDTLINPWFRHSRLGEAVPSDRDSVVTSTTVVPNVPPTIVVDAIENL